MEQITVATLNIAAASNERAHKLLEEWISPSSFDVYVFTETSEGAGTQLIASEFRAAGWTVLQRPTAAKDRGVMIVSRIRSTEATRYPTNDPAPGRALVVRLQTTPAVDIVGMYVPNRGNDPTKVERKRSFMESWLQHLTETRSSNVLRLLLGDLNVVPTAQRPKFLPQQPFEYDWYAKLNQQLGLYDAALTHNKTRHESTWVAPTGEGYTYDHVMLDKGLSDRVADFRYDHSTRKRNGITDHSAIVVTLDLDTVNRSNSSPITVQKQMRLF